MQGALKSKNELLITVFDPSIKSLEISQNRANLVKTNNNKIQIEYLDSFPSDEKFDICIISTNAEVRAKVTLHLLRNCTVRNIIFEKILFQKELDFTLISNKLNEKNISAWVNCPRRTFATFKEIKKSLDLNKGVEMYVTGNKWGMASNAIHFIDLFSFLIEKSNITITKTEFSNNLFESHRKGNFYEVNGLIEIILNNNKLVISCDDNNETLLEIKINNGLCDHRINELEGSWLKNINGNKKLEKYNLTNQSDLTGNLIDNLINYNSCSLVSFTESCNHHLTLIKEMKNHFSNVLNKKLIKCPIT